mmetsp:Transcript_39765/g.78345  ORF Transcript_39765/g.78345 Transcript_39765/m.78345 type:complete len:97 (+) Transcript_39765:2622-2912(+)
MRKDEEGQCMREAEWQEWGSRTRKIGAEASGKRKTRSLTHSPTLSSIPLPHKIFLPAWVLIASSFILPYSLLPRLLKIDLRLPFPLDHAHRQAHRL